MSANSLAANKRVAIADTANKLMTKLIIVPLLPMCLIHELAVKE